MFRAPEIFPAGLYYVTSLLMMPSVFFPLVPRAAQRVLPLVCLGCCCRGVQRYPWGDLSHCWSYPDLHCCTCNCSVPVHFWQEDDLLIRMKSQPQQGRCSLGRISTDCFVSVLSCRDLALVCLTLSDCIRDASCDD